MKTFFSAIICILALNSFGQNCSARFVMKASGYKCGIGQFSVIDVTGREIAVGEASSGSVSSAKDPRNAQAKQIGALPAGDYILSIEDADNHTFKLTPASGTLSVRSGLLIHGVNGRQTAEIAARWSILLDFNQRKKVRRYFDECGEMTLTVEHR